MSESREHRVELRFVRGYEFVATFKDQDGLPAMVFDEPAPLGEGSGPNAAAVLAAAVGNCLAASFAYCLRKVRLEPVDLTASVVAHVDRNEQGRFRVTSIDVELKPRTAGRRQGAPGAVRTVVRGLLRRHRERTPRHSGKREDRRTGGPASRVSGMTPVRWIVVLLMAAHGLIHLMGFAKAHGYAELPQLSQPVSHTMGLVWLAAGVMVLASAVLMVAWPRGWWIVGRCCARDLSGGHHNSMARRLGRHDPQHHPARCRPARLPHRRTAQLSCAVREGCRSSAWRSRVRRAARHRRRFGGTSGAGAAVSATCQCRWETEGSQLSLAVSAAASAAGPTRDGCPLKPTSKVLSIDRRDSS